MQVHAGTSGFSFDEWRGNFYPEGLPSNERLGYYSTRLGSVEINNTFYQMPKTAVLDRWRDEVSEDFRFALKAPRRITHVQRLKNTDESLGFFMNTAATLGTKLGPVLFQLPPFVRKDAGLLAEFLSLLPKSREAVFEFRHPSWLDDEIFALLANNNAALCLGDADDTERSAPFIPTANFGYLRLRAQTYDEEALRDWSKRILSQRWSRAYVFLKHEVHGPGYAMFLAAVASGKPEAALSVSTPLPALAPDASHPRKGLARAKTSKSDPVNLPERTLSRRRSA